MNGLSDALTIGVVLALVFGALFFYLYTRVVQSEKRVSLTENILLDLKMATENTLMSMHNDDNEVNHVEPISGPTPLENEEVEQIPDEEFYKNVFQNAQVPATTDLSSNPVKTNQDVNYESLSLKELKVIAKQRGIASHSVAKKELIDLLKKQSRFLSDPLPGSLGGSDEGFPVELGSSESTENRKVEQE